MIRYIKLSEAPTFSITYFENMSKDEIQKFMDDAPEGTIINGFYSRRYGRECKFEKVSYYERNYAVEWAGRTVTEWEGAGEHHVGGSRIYKILLGKDKYFTV